MLQKNDFLHSIAILIRGSTAILKHSNYRLSSRIERLQLEHRPGLGQGLDAINRFELVVEPVAVLAVVLLIPEPCAELQLRQLYVQLLELLLPPLQPDEQLLLAWLYLDQLCFDQFYFD